MTRHTRTGWTLIAGVIALGWWGAPLAGSGGSRTSFTPRDTRARRALTPAERKTGRQPTCHVRVPRFDD